MNREYSVSIVATNWVSVKASSEEEAEQKALSLGVFETLDGADYNVVSISGPVDQPPPEPPKTKSVRIRFTRTETFTRDIEIGEELFDQNYNEEDLCRDIYYQLREEDDLFVGQIPDDCDEKVELVKEEAGPWYKIRDIESGDIYEMTVPMILQELNRDRVDSEGVLKPGIWGLYDETDWRDGLAENGTYEVVAD